MSPETLGCELTGNAVGSRAFHAAGPEVLALCRQSCILRASAVASRSIIRQSWGLSSMQMQHNTVAFSHHHPSTRKTLGKTSASTSSAMGLHGSTRFRRCHAPLLQGLARQASWQDLSESEPSDGDRERLQRTKLSSVFPLQDQRTSLRCRPDDADEDTCFGATPQFVRAAETTVKCHVPRVSPEARALPVRKPEETCKSSSIFDSSGSHTTPWPALGLNQTAGKVTVVIRGAVYLPSSGSVQ